jgi:hypothetical protein
MILGDMLQRLNDDGAAAELLMRAGDLALLASMRRQAEAEGVDLAAYTRALVQRYAASASNEEWVTVMGVIGRASDPAITYLKRALEQTLHRCAENE